MAPEIYWIPEVVTGRLGLMARPRAGDWLRDEVSAWREAGVNVVISLLETSEIVELDLRDEERLCRESDIEFVSFPIADRGVPTSVAQTAQLVDHVVSRLHAQRAVAIHCRAGIGRSTLIAACVLYQLGFPMEEVFARLTLARRVSVPDTPTQTQWLSTFARQKAMIVT